MLLYWYVFRSEKKGIPNLFWRQEGLVGKGKDLKDLKTSVSGLVLVSKIVQPIFSSPILVFCAAPYTLHICRIHQQQPQVPAPTLKPNSSKGKSNLLDFSCRDSVHQYLCDCPSPQERRFLCIYSCNLYQSCKDTQNFKSIKLIWHARQSTC